ncbi:olfactory receptor 10J5-like [Boleophthalmus pectinirostris]|uniref:olfactory receptor 10J5-like n=1 Tax=Boleophthalmus pectinirostris TaxID=150288 RepID=UPI00242AFB79|nr:olfactory receptor 10J5-like [Boleophthalmus pectinirostris]
MSNWTQVAHFSLGGYSEPGPLRWFYFLFILCAYALILSSNLLLVALIAVSRSLHQPMYLLLCSLFVNEVLGSSALFPFLLHQVLQEEHIISYSLCYLQIFCIYLYACVEVFTLAAMAYDRYVAICRPLRYHALMTRGRVALLLCGTWSVPAAFIAALVWLSAALPLCGNVIDRVYCGNYAVVKLACSSTRLQNIYGLFYMVLQMVLPLLLILYTYGRILHVCLSAPGRARHRARLRAAGTCVPHLSSLLNFCLGCCSQVLMSRFDVSWIPAALQVTLSLYFFTCQPLFNPVIYGLNLRQVRQELQRLSQGHFS